MPEKKVPFNMVIKPDTKRIILDTATICKCFAVSGPNADKNIPEEDRKGAPNILLERIFDNPTLTRLIIEALNGVVIADGDKFLIR